MNKPTTTKPVHPWRLSFKRWFEDSKKLELARRIGAIRRAKAKE